MQLALATVSFVVPYMTAFNKGRVQREFQEKSRLNLLAKYFCQGGAQKDWAE